MITMKVRILLAPVSFVMLMGVVRASLMIFPMGDRKEIKAGKTLLLSCQHSDQSKTIQDINMQWRDPNNNIITDSTDSVLLEPSDDARTLKMKFVNIQSENSGDFTCEATVNGNLEQVKISVMVVDTVTLVSPKDQSIINGTDAKVWCRTSKSFDQKKMKWYLRGPSGEQMKLDKDKFKPMMETAQGQEGNYLLIINANLQDSGTYICSLEFLLLGETENFDIDVLVTVPPKMMPIHQEPMPPTEGDRLVITCKASGVPEPTYMFYKDNKELLADRSAEGRYVFEAVSKQDEGRYKCNAENKGGEKDILFTVDVKIPPTISSDKNLSAEEDTRNRLECEAQGEPDPSLFWLRKGSDVYFLNQQNSESEIYVEEEEEDPIEDEGTILYKRKLYLVFPKVKSEHAGEYVCKASNQFGMREKTFKVEVKFKPNFKNQLISSFYGWEGSKTNMTCIANANPEPLIKWHKDDRELENDPNYKVTMGQSGLNTRVISYLEPVVTNTNKDSMFGRYRCEASNRYGTTNQFVDFKLAMVPEMPVVSVIATKATEMILNISPPSNDGGQPVIRYFVKYGPTDSADEPSIKNIARIREEPSNQVTLEGLTPETQYSIKVYAINSVGQGQEKNIVEFTKSVSRPDPVQVVSDRVGMLGTEYELQWNVPMTGGIEISNYVVQCYRVLEVDTTSDPWRAVRMSPSLEISKSVEGQSNTFVTLTGLQRKTYYRATIKAVNRIGASDESSFVFVTGTGGPKSIKDDGPAMGAAGIVGLVLVILLLLALTVDAAFFKTKQCGLIWTISNMMGRKDQGPTGASKSPEDGDEAAAKLLGKEKEELRVESEVDKGTGERTVAQQGGQDMEEQPKTELEPEDKEKLDLPEDSAKASGETKPPGTDVEFSAKEPADKTAKA